MNNNIDKDAEIVDLGCGTGLLGEILFNLGYKNIIGVDGSEEMLNICR